MHSLSLVVAAEETGVKKYSSAVQHHDVSIADTVVKMSARLISPVERLIPQ